MVKKKTQLLIGRFHGIDARIICRNLILIRMYLPVHVHVAKNLMANVGLHLRPVGFYLSPVGFHLGPVSFHLGPVGFYLGPVGLHLGPVGFHLGPVGFLLRPCTNVVSGCFICI